MKDRQSKLRVWQKLPAEFFKDPLGVSTLEDYQARTIQTIADFDNVLIRACHSVGKTWMLARVALWFFTCFRNSIIISTAPTNKQVEMLLWGEIRDAHKNARINLGGRLLNTKLTISDKWYAIGFSPQKSAGTSDGQQGSTFQGFHSDYVLIIFDEATGISADLWKMADGLMTSGKIVKFVAIANPTTRACELFERMKSFKYKKLHLSCFDSPNLKANGFEDKHDLKEEVDRLFLLKEDERLRELESYKAPVPHLLSAKWVISYIMDWGITHPLVLAKVFGEFPDADDSVLIPMSVVEAAQARNHDIEAMDKGLRTIGVDCARYGTDKSVIVEMVGVKQTDMKAVAKRDTMEVTGHVVRMLKDSDHASLKTVVTVDATGIGSGVFDRLMELQREGDLPKSIEFIEVHFGSTEFFEKDEKKLAKLKARFLNLKAYAFQLLADDLKSSLDIFDDSNFLKEIPTIKSEPNSAGKMCIESKKDYKKRTGRPSPDYADALALSNLGRYVNIGVGSFKNLSNEPSKPLVKQANRRIKSSGIKVSSY